MTTCQFNTHFLLFRALFYGLGFARFFRLNGSFHSFVKYLGQSSDIFAEGRGSKQLLMGGNVDVGEIVIEMRAAYAAKAIAP